MVLFNNRTIMQGVVVIFMASIISCAPGDTQKHVGRGRYTHEEMVKWCYDSIVNLYGPLNSITCHDLSNIQLRAVTTRHYGNEPVFDYYNYLKNNIEYDKWINNPHQNAFKNYTDGNGSVHDPAYIEQCIFRGVVLNPSDYCNNVWNYDNY